jgi:hypothetical protein
MPRSARDFPPRIVCVLPVPVTPYANRVISKPAKRCLIVGATAQSYQSPDSQQCSPLPLTLSIKNILLCSFLPINTIKLEAKVLALVLRIGYAYDCGGDRSGILRADGGNYCIFVELVLEKGPDTGNYAHRHAELPESRTGKKLGC